MHFCSIFSCFFATASSADYMNLMLQNDYLFVTEWGMLIIKGNRKYVIREVCLVM